jgi:hypothetical protein
MAPYNLGRFEAFSSRHKLLPRDYPDNDAGRAQMQRVQQRVREQTSGEYDFRSMYNGVRAGSRHLDIATFADSVAVQPSPGRGRGLFTTRAVRAGELLLCEKAFVYCGGDNPRTSRTPLAAKSSSTSLSSNAPSPLSGTCVPINLPANRVTIGKQADVITSAIRKVFQNPSLGPKFMSLHSGSYESVDAPGLMDGQPEVDSSVYTYLALISVAPLPSQSCLKKHVSSAS